MSNLTYSGRPASFEAVEPSGLGRLFGTNSYLFNIESTEAGSTSPPKTIPVRVDCFMRCPSLENMQIQVVGSFDADGILRANWVDVKDSGVFIRGVRRFNLVVAILLLFGTVFLAGLLGVIVLMGGFQIVLESIEGGTPIFILVRLLYIVAAVAIFLPAWIFISHTAIPSIYEGAVRLISRLVSYSK